MWFQIKPFEKFSLTKFLRAPESFTKDLTHSRSGVSLQEVSREHRDVGMGDELLLVDSQDLVTIELRSSQDFCNVVGRVGLDSHPSEHSDTIC